MPVDCVCNGFSSCMFLSFPTLKLRTQCRMVAWFDIILTVFIIWESALWLIYGFVQLPDGTRFVLIQTNITVPSNCENLAESSSGRFNRAYPHSSKECDSADFSSYIVRYAAAICLIAAILSVNCPFYLLYGINKRITAFFTPYIFCGFLRVVSVIILIVKFHSELDLKLGVVTSICLAVELYKPCIVFAYLFRLKKEKTKSVSEKAKRKSESEEAKHDSEGEELCFEQSKSFPKRPTSGRHLRPENSRTVNFAEIQIVS